MVLIMLMLWKIKRTWKAYQVSLLNQPISATNQELVNNMFPRKLVWQNVTGNFGLSTLFAEPDSIIAMTLVEDESFLAEKGITGPLETSSKRKELKPDKLQQKKKMNGSGKVKLFSLKRKNCNILVEKAKSGEKEIWKQVKDIFTFGACLSDSQLSDYEHLLIKEDERITSWKDNDRGTIQQKPTIVAFNIPPYRRREGDISSNEEDDVDSDLDSEQGSSSCIEDGKETEDGNESEDATEGLHASHEKIDVKCVLQMEKRVTRSASKLLTCPTLRRTNNVHS